MKKLVIFGNGQVADIIYDYFKNDNNFEVISFCVDDKFYLKKKHFNLPVIPISKLKKYYPPKENYIFVALSYSNINQKRKEKFNQLKKMGYSFANLIVSKSSLPSSVVIGKNVAVLDSKCIQPFTQIKDNVFIWNGTIIGHHSVLQNHCWITSGSNIGGNSIIGEKSFLGLNSTVGNMVKIGKNCFLGANSLITKNLSSNRVCVNKDTNIFPLQSPDFIRLTKFK